MKAVLEFFPDALHYTELDGNNNIMRGEIIKFSGVTLSKDKINLEGLNTAFKQLRKKNPVPFVLKIPDAVIKILNYPADMTIEDVKHALLFEASENFGFKKSEMTFDVIKCSDATKNFFLFAGVKKSALIEILDLALSSGLKIKSVEPVDKIMPVDIKYHGAINLIPPEYIVEQRRLKTVTLTKIAGIIFTSLFLILSASVLGLAYVNFRTLSSQNALLKQIAGGKKLKRDDLININSRLQAKRRIMDETLKFMADDIPVLEILHAVEANAGAGLNFSDVNFFKDNKGRAVVIHAAASDDEISTAMAKGLQSVNLFDSVTIDKSTNNPEGLTDLKMTLRIKSSQKNERAKRLHVN